MFKFLVLFFLCFPVNAIDIVCTGDDANQIALALALNESIRLSGDCVLSSTITIPSNRVITGLARIHSYSSPVFIFMGQNITMRDLTVNASGIGMRLQEAYKVRLENIQINSLAGNSIVAANGAGLWLSQIHINGTQNSNTIAIKFENWDSAWLRDVLIEEHDTGIRFGSGTGTTANIFLSGVVVDRARVAFNIEPDGTASAQNILISNCWASGSATGIVPASISGGSTTGFIGSIVFDTCYFSDFPNKEFWTYQLDGKLITSNIIFQ